MKREHVVPRQEERKEQQEQLDAAKASGPGGGNLRRVGMAGPTKDVELPSRNAPEEEVDSVGDQQEEDAEAVIEQQKEDLEKIFDNGKQNIEDAADQAKQQAEDEVEQAKQQAEDEVKQAEQNAESEAKAEAKAQLEARENELKAKLGPLADEETAWKYRNASMQAALDASEGDLKSSIQAMTSLSMTCAELGLKQQLAQAEMSLGQLQLAAGDVESAEATFNSVKEQAESLSMDSLEQMADGKLNDMKLSGEDQAGAQIGPLKHEILADLGKMNLEGLSKFADSMKANIAQGRAFWSLAVGAFDSLANIVLHPRDALNWGEWQDIINAEELDGEDWIASEELSEQDWIAAQEQRESDAIDEYDPTDLTASRASAYRQRNQNTDDPSPPSNGIVDPTTGAVRHSGPSVDLGDNAPVDVRTSYSSSWSHRSSTLGPGWSSSLDQKVWREPWKVVYQNEQGNEIEFDTHALKNQTMNTGDTLTNAREGVELRCLGWMKFEVEKRDGTTLEFAVPKGAQNQNVARLVGTQHPSNGSSQAQHNANGDVTQMSGKFGAASMNYNARGQLESIISTPPSNAAQSAANSVTAATYASRSALAAIANPAPPSNAASALASSTGVTSAVSGATAPLSGASRAVSSAVTPPSTDALLSAVGLGKASSAMAASSKTLSSATQAAMLATPSGRTGAVNRAAFNYSPQGNLISATGANGVETKYHYAANLVVGTQVGNAPANHFIYDGRDSSAHCAHAWSANHKSITDFSYDKKAHKTLALGKNGKMQLIDSNATYQVTRSVDEKGAITEFSYNKQRLVVRRSDKNGVWYWGYDARGNVARAGAPDRSVATVKWDRSRAIQMKQVGHKEQMTRWEYDRLQRLVRATTNGETTSIDYAATGQRAVQFTSGDTVAITRPISPILKKRLADANIDVGEQEQLIARVPPVYGPTTPLAPKTLLGDPPN